MVQMTREESIEFYKAHSKRLYNISLRIVRDSGEAEEIMQDTILKYITGPLGRMVAEGAVAVWLNRTCIRASIDALRRRNRERLFLDEYASTEQELQAEELSQEELPDMRAIRDAVESLRDPYRLVLSLILIEGLDYEEISEITGEREGTIRTQYSRARKMLSEVLKRTKKSFGRI